MNTFFHPALSSAFWTHLLAVLGHTLWQGAVAAVCLWLVLRRLPADRPEGRYLACMLTLGAMVAAACLTWWAPAVAWQREPPVAWASAPEEQEAAVRAPAPAEPAGATVVGGAPRPVHAAQRSLVPPLAGKAAAAAWWVPWLGWSWLGGVALMLVRLVRSVHGATRLAGGCVPLTDPAVLGWAAELQRLLGIARPVGLAVSPHLSSPAVVGGWKPVVLLPASFLTGIPADHLRAILAHELAHIRRYDYLVNIGQMLVEALLFFNPAVWWVSRQMRHEREACCDALAGRAMAGADVFAEALALAAEKAAKGSPLPLAAAAAYDPRAPGALADRVRRLLIPGYRPEARLPWYALLASLFAWSGILAGIWGGSLATVAVAARILTPAERLAEVVAAERRYGAPNAPLPDPDDRKETRPLEVRLRFEDGRPLPRHKTITAVIIHPKHHLSKSVQADSTGLFRSLVPATGELYLNALEEGYAPAFSDRVDLAADTTAVTAELVLGPGYTGRIRVTDAEDRPVSGALITGGYWIARKDGASLRGQLRPTLSGPDGLAEIAHLAKHPVRLQISAPGFEWDSKTDILLPGEEALTWKLRPTPAAEGVVVDDASGEPVAGAALRLVSASTGNTGHGYSPDSATTVAISGQDGRFRLTELRRDSTYQFVVDAPPRRRAWLTNVTAGQKDLEIRMGGPLFVSGWVELPPGELASCMRGYWADQLHVEIDSEKARPGRSPHLPRERVQEWRTVPAERRGDRAFFRLDNLFEGPTRIVFSLCGKQPAVELDLKEPVEDLQVGGATLPREEAETTRPVLVRFQVPPGSPPPSGTVSFCRRYKAGENSMLCEQPVPITGTEMRFTAPVPGRAGVRPAGTLGYWFDEDHSVEVPAGDGEFILDVPCVPAGSLGGVVVDADGKALPAASLSLRILEKAKNADSFWRPDSIPVSADGAFHLTPLPLGGRYQITAKLDGGRVVSEPVTLDETRPMADLLLQFPRGVSVQGIVRGTGGQPVADEEVTLWAADGTHGWITLQTVNSGAEGRFLLRNVNPEERPWIIVNPRSRYQPGARPVPSGGGKVEITLEPGRVLEGKVLDPEGRPLPEAEVLAIPRGQPAAPDGPPPRLLRAEARTDRQGQFRFSNLPDEEITFTVSEGQIDNGPVVRPGSQEFVVLRVKQLWRR